MKKMPWLTLVSTLLVFTAGTALAEGNPNAGKRKSEDCGDCHGQRGEGDGDTIPAIAGLPVERFMKAMHDFQSGARKKSPMMTKQSTRLSDEDKADLAAYYASLKP